MDTGHEVFPVSLYPFEEPLAGENAYLIRPGIGFDLTEVHYAGSTNSYPNRENCIGYKRGLLFLFDLMWYFLYNIWIARVVDNLDKNGLNDVRIFDFVKKNIVYEYCYFYIA